MDSGLTGAAAEGSAGGKPRQGRIKCVVWDLDGTIWDGVLLEGDQLALRPGVAEVIRVLDERGILHSVASRNDADAATAQLKHFGLDEYFLYPKIGWQPKSTSVAAVAQALNIGLDAVAFVDDQAFEREEVAFAHPQVLCVPADQIGQAVRQRDEFRPRFITDESSRRREMYRSGVERDQAEREAKAVGEDFLATLGMVFTISRAGEEDLKRAEELAIRTNQLNSTGRTYSYEELRELCESPGHLLLIANLEDRFGSYGKIGLALVETAAAEWTLRLLLMSCRVLARGVGSVLLNYVMTLALDSGARLRAEFVETGRNRLMYVTYRFAGFREVERTGDTVVLEANPGAVKPPPAHLKLLAQLERR